MASANTHPKFMMVAQGSITTPKLDIAIWTDKPSCAVEEATKVAATLHKAGYFMFALDQFEEGQDLPIEVASFTVEQPEVAVTVKMA